VACHRFVMATTGVGNRLAITKRRQAAALQIDSCGTAVVMSEAVGRLVQVIQLIEMNTIGNGTWTSSPANEENVI